MGYWKEKAKYNEDLERRGFCRVCGIFLIEDNTLGKCIECKKAVCISCGDKVKGMITCNSCVDYNKKYSKSNFIIKFLMSLEREFNKDR
tara:strand:+ start:405 stop:671 length:267 start_codon:yes stop_codon:yes gene_type:complete